MRSCARSTIFRAVVGPDAEAFITTTAPASLEPYRRNEYYKSDEEFVFALAEAMRTEYQAIVEAGFILQIDDAWLVALWDRIGIPMGLEAFRKYCEMRIEALNHALRGLPEERIRYHLCWGSWHGPHAYDIELEKLVDLMLQGAGAGLSDRGCERTARARIRDLGTREAAGGQDPHPGHGLARDRRHRASGARRTTHPPLREARRGAKT